MRDSCKYGENADNVVAEEQLNVVTGGATQNRYDSKKCIRGMGHILKECWTGPMFSQYCDHYTGTVKGRSNDGKTVYWHNCAMRCFDYHGDWEGTPVQWP